MLSKNVGYKTTVAEVLEVAQTEIVLTSLATADKGSVKLSMITFYEPIAKELLRRGYDATATVNFKLEYRLPSGVNEVSTFTSAQLANAITDYNSYVDVL